MRGDFKLLINGDLVDGASHFPVINPATEEIFATCPKADASQLDRAVAAAQAAFPAWSAKSYDERASFMLRLADAMEAQAKPLARMLTSEQGKPLPDAFSEIHGAASLLRTCAAMRMEDVILRDEANHHIVEHRTALGVCAAITPWNYPIILLMNALGPGLVTGNTFIAKPAPTTPLTTLLFGELARDILPPGVLNILCDEHDLAPLLTSHPGVAKIAFTGSTATGKKVMASAAQGLKRLTLELGGNDVAIVLDDVPPALAARNVYAGAMVNAGQVCTATKRVFIPEAMKDAFCAEIATLAKAAIVDDGMKQGTTIGPLQNHQQYERVRALLEDAKQRGRAIAGGDLPDRRGYFIPPTIITDIADDAPLVREEQFGPVLPVLTYSSIDEVIARANASDYGLAGTIWGKDITRATQIARRIDTGTIWVNHQFDMDPALPFRGSRQSGIGTKMGADGLKEYTQAHIINSRPLHID